MLRAELHKLFSDKKVKVLFFLIFLYLLYSFFIVEPSIDRTFEEWVVSGTTDSILMNFLIGIVGAVLFTMDYANTTYKNFLPYARKRDVFIAKILGNFIGVFVLLLFWYGVAWSFSGILANKRNFNVLVPLAGRFVFQYFMILFHTSLIVIAGTVTKNSAIASSFTIVSWILYAFIPIKDKLLYDFIVAGYVWKATAPQETVIFAKIPLNITLVILFIFCYAAACFIGFQIFNRQEV